MKLKKTSLILKLVILALVVYAGINLISLKTQISEAQARRDLLQQQVENTMEENSRLQYAIDHHTDPEMIEDFARNKLGLVMPGEKIFITSATDR